MVARVGGGGAGAAEPAIIRWKGKRVKRRSRQVCTEEGGRRVRDPPG